MGLNEEELPDVVEQIKQYIESPEFIRGRKMTVSELMDALREVPGDCDVQCLYDSGCAMTPIVGVKVDRSVVVLLGD